ncbi:hypothetical protein TCAL_17119 [Tigriopus californicus]|uniref:Reverse transcriptase/retrotransposon-derived protein RNase H-like domain-containing protein n=1 Tax=Tigriopus californicus TaxID=6832 RepID=A0A553P4R2_TIGCA|nr:hypothetical protein TCAL_17119 [Tigriopus californicus]
MCVRRSFGPGPFQPASHVPPDLAQATPLLRSLLKKETAFKWTPNHQREFNNAKAILASPSVVYPFNQTLKSMLYMDAS